MKLANIIPLVSIVIVNWNGKKYLKRCLHSLSKINYKSVEIIVVDQNSHDGSCEMVRKKFPRVFLIESSENTGYVGGNNLGVSKAQGRYVLILNNDIEVERSFLEPLVDAFEKNKKLGVAQPKAINLRHKGKLDGAGSFFTKTGFLYHKGYMNSANKPDYNEKYPVYSAKGAYMMTRKNLWKRVGGLDPDFFIYFEETDYCGRVWLSGYTIEYIPESLVYHWGGADTKEDRKKRLYLVQYRSYRNRICSYIKNLSASNLIIVIPLHLFLCQIISLTYLLLANFKISFSIQRAILWNILNIRKTLAKRKVIQSKLRKVDDKKIFKLVEFNPRLSFYLGSFKFLLK